MRSLCSIISAPLLGGGRWHWLVAREKGPEDDCVQDGTCRSAAVSVGHYMQNDSTDRWALLRE